VEQLFDLARRVEQAFAAAGLSGARTVGGVRLTAIPDLLGIQLTSFRLEDQMHLKDLDEAGVITPEVEATLTPLLRERLAEVRGRG
jgi:hypothetical protein